MSKITFVIPNRGGKHIDFVISQLKKFYPNDDYIVVCQEDNEPFKRGQLFNVSYNYIKTDYICFIDNDLFFKGYVDLIGLYKKKNCQVLMPFNVIEQVDVIDKDKYKVTKIGNKLIIGDDNRFGPRGGITFLSTDTFKKMDGYSNLLIGYGYEDNEFACRCDKSGFVNIDNHICHITHPTRDTKNLHQQLNCVLFNNEDHINHGGFSTTLYTEVYNKNIDGVMYIGATDIRSTNERTMELLSLHNPENIRVACEYMCDFYVKKHIKGNYTLVLVPKHMNIGDTMIWEAERDLLNKLPYKRVATYFYGTYMSNIKISETDTIVFSGGGYINDIWGGTLDYINRILTSFPKNPIVFLPNSVYIKNPGNPDLKKMISLLKKRSKKPVLMSREYQGIKNARRIFGSSVTHELVPDVVLSWNVESFMKSHNIDFENGNGQTLFLDRNDREKIGVVKFKYDKNTDWLQMKKRPEYADEKMRCVDWEANVKDRLLSETIRFVNKYSRVYSNRMHGAILSWLLGKETYLINNSYGKSKSLYETWFLDDKKIKLIDK